MKRLLTVLVVVIMTIVAQAQSTVNGHNPLVDQTIFSAPPVIKGVKMKQGASRSGLTIPGPVINFTGNQALRIGRTLRNTSDSTISFYFDHLFKNDQEFIDYLRGFITNPSDTPQAQRELISALFDVTKYYFSNNTLIFDWQGNSDVFKKEMSFIGFLYSMHNVQCGNFFRHAVTILIASHYFVLSDFETIDVPGHSIGQIMNVTKPIFTDFDAGTGFSWDKNVNSVNGYANIDEIRQDTFLINDYYKFHGKVLVDTTQSYQTRANYRHLLTGNPLNRGSLQGYVPPISMTGLIALPAHSLVETQISSIILAFDTKDSTSLYRISNLIAVLQPIYQAGGCTWCMDSFLTVITEEFHMDKQLLNAQPLFFVRYNSDTDQGKTFGSVFNYNYEREALPVWTISGSNTDTVKIGSDLMLPFLLLNAQGITGSAVVGDTVFTTPATFHLWDPGTASPLVTSPEVNYVQSGFIPPSHNWNMTVAVNAHAGILSLLEDWSVDIKSGQGLVFENQVTQLSTQVTGISTTGSEQLMFQMYPNPTQESVFLKLPEGVTILDVYDALGVKVLQMHNGQNSVASLSSGLYFVQGKKLVIL